MLGDLLELGHSVDDLEDLDHLLIVGRLSCNFIESLALDDELCDQGSVLLDSSQVGLQDEVNVLDSSLVDEPL